MNQVQRTKLLEQIAEQAVPESIDLWPTLRARVEARAAPARAARRGWLAIAAAATVVVVLAVGLVTDWTGPQAVSAETILDRAVTTAESPTTVKTYHLLMTRQHPAKGEETAHTEVWFGGPDRQRTTERVTDAGGALQSLQDVIFNGPETWIVLTEGGHTRAIHTIGTTWNKPADDPAALGGLAELLSRYGPRQQCMAARLQAGDGMVAGQPTYVIEVAPKPVVACGAPSAVSPVPAASSMPGRAEQAARLSGQVTGSRLEAVRQPRVWVSVDKQSFLPLKTEVRDATGTVLERSEVTRVDYNVAIPEATFTYTPPAGVPVSTFTGGNGADVKRALASGEPKPTPGKAP